MNKPARFLLLIAVLLAATPHALRLIAQPSAGSGAKLQYTVILSRHGARTPLDTPEQMRDYAPQPWPPFDAPTGYLTPRGNKLIDIVGAYDRSYLIQQGLLPATGCAERDRFYIWADSMGRDIETAWLLGHALMPACEITVHRVSEGAKDPLFSAVDTGIGKLDRATEKAEYLRAVGGSAEALMNSYRSDLEMMDQLVLGCKAGPNCPAPGVELKKPIMKQSPLTLPDNAAPSSPMISAAGTVGEAFLLEYLDGMDMKNVAWGRLDAAKIHEVRRFVARNYSRLTRYNARSSDSNLLSHINKSLEQAVRGTAVPGSVGKAGDKALILLGHDSNMWRIGRILNLNWEAEKGLAMEAPPTCHLTFELWREADGRQTVHTWFQTQTFDQLRNMTPLSLKNPPVRIPIQIPGCTAVSVPNSCEWETFRKVIDAAIDPAFVAVPKIEK